MIILHEDEAEYDCSILPVLEERVKKCLLKGSKVFFDLMGKTDLKKFKNHDTSLFISSIDQIKESPKVFKIFLDDEGGVGFFCDDDYEMSIQDYAPRFDFGDAYVD